MLIFVLVCLVVMVIVKYMPGPKVHCLECDHDGDSVKITKGHILIEIVLWLCFMIPGLIYTIWRNTSGKTFICEDCKSERLVPLEKWKARK